MATAFEGNGAAPAAGRVRWALRCGPVPTARYTPPPQSSHKPVRSLADPVPTTPAPPRPRPHPPEDQRVAAGRADEAPRHDARRGAREDGAAVGHALQRAGARAGDVLQVRVEAAEAAGTAGAQGVVVVGDRAGRVAAPSQRGAGAQVGAAGSRGSCAPEDRAQSMGSMRATRARPPGVHPAGGAAGRAAAWLVPATLRAQAGRSQIARGGALPPPAFLVPPHLRE